VPAAQRHRRALGHSVYPGREVSSSSSSKQQQQQQLQLQLEALVTRYLHDKRGPCPLSSAVHCQPTSHPGSSLVRGRGPCCVAEHQLSSVQQQIADARKGPRAWEQTPFPKSRAPTAVGCGECGAQRRCRPHALPMPQAPCAPRRSHPQAPHATDH
jgi:hypothetical protein